MAHFAEINEDGLVLRVVVACNQDIANNGGEQSKEAAKFFERVVRLSNNGVEWVQTSYNNNFRKQFAGTGFTYNKNADVFISPKPYNSWSLDNNYDWQAPVQKPLSGPENIEFNTIEWNEQNLRWQCYCGNNIVYYWNPNNSSWNII